MDTDAFDLGVRIAGLCFSLKKEISLKLEIAAFVDAVRHFFKQYLLSILFLSSCFIFAVLGTQPRALHTLRKRGATEIHP